MEVKVENMDVSIIIPIYNGARYIKRVTECLLDQKHRDFEAILVDDGSKDHSLELCRELVGHDKRFVLLSQANAGASEARNAGLRVAKGRYVCFADVDDLFNERYLEDLLSQADGVDLVIQGRVRLQKDSGHVIHVPGEGSYDLDQDPERFFSAIDIEQYGAPYCKLFSTRIIRDNHLFFSREILLGEDFDFLLRYLCFCHRVVIDDKANYSYRTIPGSLSTKKYPVEKEYSGLKQIDHSWRTLLSRFPSLSLQPIYGRSIAYHVYRSIFGIYRSRFDRKQRIHYLKQLSREHGSV